MSRRYHALAAATSVVTLAAGVVVGVGPLAQRQVVEHNRQVGALRDQLSRLEASLAAASREARRDQAFAEALARPVTRGRLSGSTVLVVAVPGADRALVRRTTTVLRRAGATVTGTLSLTATYVDPAKAQSPLEDLALRLVPPDVTFTHGARPIERVGTVLARATVTTDPRPGTAAKGIDQKGAEVVAGLEELDALTLTGEPGRRAEQAVVVTGPANTATGSRDRARGAEQALLGLVAALDAGSRGTVVLGTGGTGGTRGTGGLVAAARAAGSTRTASTVDTAGSVAGDVALVLALAEQAQGRAGSYGSGPGADALVPDLPGAAAGG